MSQVTISRDDAVAICIGLGFKTAQSWDKKRMLRKLGDIVEMVNDSGLKIEDGVEDAPRLNKLLKAIGKAGGDVSVVKEVRDEEPTAEEEPVASEQEDVSDDSGDEETTEDEPEATEAEDTEPVKPVKGKKKTKPAKEKKTKAKKPEDSAETDRFGFREGTKVSRFLACLSKDPKTVKQLCEEAGTPQQRGALPGLIEKGLVVKDGSSYRLA